MTRFEELLKDLDEESTNGQKIGGYEMRSFEIWYEVQTMNGTTNVHIAKNLTKEEFEHFCNECKRLGYKIVLCNNF